MSSLRTLISGLAAVTTLIAVVIGLPVVLYRFGGSPLPHRLGGWQHIATVLTSRDNGSMLLGIVRECSWLGWLLFTVAVLAEVQAALRGRTAPRLWLGGMQVGAARLVALAALTFAAPSSISLTAAVSPVAPAHVGHGESATAFAAIVTNAAPTPPSASLDAAHAQRLIMVRPGDCLWTLAQHYLGAGDRYPEIAEMNYGHDMGDGQVFANPSLIEPGWHLVLPAFADHDGRSGTRASEASVGRARHLGHATNHAHFRRQHSAAVQATAGGQLPADRAGSAGSVAARGSAAADAYRASAAVATSAGEHLTEAAAFGVGALAGAVLTSLSRLRRRQRQYRRRGRRIALPADPEVLAAEQRLRAAAPVASAPSSLQEALTYLESGITATRQALPDIVGLHVTPSLLEVLLAAPAVESPPAPYCIAPGREGMCWQLELEHSGTTAPAAVTGRGSGLLPGLFAAGQTDEGYLLLDLESLQVTGCDGPPDLIDQVVSAAATELATGQWSGWYELVLVGFDELEVLGRAEHCATFEAALRLLDARCSVLSTRLADHPRADVRQLRLQAPDDEDWGLTILVSRIEPAADQLTHLLELAEDGPGGIAALVAGDPETADGRMAPTVLQLAPDPEQPGGITANIIPLQITVRPQLLSSAEYEAIGTLFATATDPADVSPHQAPYEIYSAPPWIPQAASMGQAFDDLAWPERSDPAAPEAYPEVDPVLGAEVPERSSAALAQEGRLELKILGPFVISGAAEQLQPKQAELLLALALAAPAGLTNSALCGMLGADPDHPKPSDAVRQIITRTRRRLGRARDGLEYVIHTGNGNYVLHPDVSLDWTEFRELTARGGADDIRAALALVRGQPFTGSYYWWIDIPLLETVRAEIVDAAETLAEFELATGSSRAAARAARAGLAAEASAEQLWRMLMRAEHAAGNLAGVGEAWRRCLDTIEDVAPGGEPHPDTEALYRQLSSGSRQQAPVMGR